MMYTHQVGTNWGVSDDNEEESINEDSMIEVGEWDTVELNR